MKKHSARVAPLSACNSPVLTLTKVEGKAAGRGRGAGFAPRGGTGGRAMPDLLERGPGSFLPRVPSEPRAPGASPEPQSSTCRWEPTAGKEGGRSAAGER